MTLFSDFLAFERQVFGDPSPITTYDPYLIRYGEYSFVLDALDEVPSTVLDLGCETNILMLYLAFRGARVIGVDIDPAVRKSIDERVAHVEGATGKKLPIRIEIQDATELAIEDASVDAAVAVSSIEHMFSDNGDGDRRAVNGIARALRSGGLAVITVPMSNGAPFHESRTGDARFAGPYRLYTPEKLAERIAHHPDLENVSLKYLAQRTPDSRCPDTRFVQFWANELTDDERLKWAWANPMLQRIFNPVVPEDEGVTSLESVNTALVCLRKRATRPPRGRPQAALRGVHERPRIINQALRREEARVGDSSSVEDNLTHGCQRLQAVHNALAERRG